MQVKLKNVKPVRKRLASGEVVTYYYHRATGKRILGTPGTVGFLAAFEIAGATEAGVPKDSLAALLLAFRHSPKFANLRDRTRRDYEKHLDAIETRFGSWEIEAFEDHHIRKDIMEWRDGLAKRSHKQADYAMAVLRLTLQWAYDQGRLSINHAMRVGKLYTPNRADKIWEDSQIEAFMRVAHETMRQAFLLALDTGQRQGDLLRLTWTAFDGEAITLRQSKRGRLVYVPLTAELRAMLGRMPRTAATVLTNQSGLPWTSDGFRTMFDRAKHDAGISDRTFHDLRGTFVTRAAMRGATPQEIATVTGHALKEVESILDTYTARRPEMARSLMRKYERGTKTGNRTGNRLKAI